MNWEDLLQRTDIIGAELVLDFGAIPERRLLIQGVSNAYDDTAVRFETKPGPFFIQKTAPIKEHGDGRIVFTIPDAGVGTIVPRQANS